MAYDLGQLLLEQLERTPGRVRFRFEQRRTKEDFPSLYSSLFPGRCGRIVGTQSDLGKKYQHDAPQPAKERSFFQPEIHVAPDSVRNVREEIKLGRGSNQLPGHG